MVWFATISLSSSLRANHLMDLGTVSRAFSAYLAGPQESQVIVPVLRCNYRALMHQQILRNPLL